jgi:hypothetical protein
MRIQKNYIIGFDRFIKLSWADYVLDLRLRDYDRQSGVENLKKWLSKEIGGEDSIRKTSDLLRRLWLDQYEPSLEIQKQALILAQEIPIQQRIWLHWGMSLLIFPFFRDTVSTIGKLFFLQNMIGKNEVISRVAEKYGNNGSVTRATARIIQTLQNWQVLESIKSSIKEKDQRYETDSKNLKQWIQFAVTNNPNSDQISDIKNSKFPEIFPFCL